MERHPLLCGLSSKNTLVSRSISRSKPHRSGGAPFLGQAPYVIIPSMGCSALSGLGLGFRDRGGCADPNRLELEGMVENSRHFNAGTVRFDLIQSRRGG